MRLRVLWFLVPVVVVAVVVAVVALTSGGGGEAEEPQRVAEVETAAEVEAAEVEAEEEEPLKEEPAEQPDAAEVEAAEVVAEDEESAVTPEPPEEAEAATPEPADVAAPEQPAEETPATPETTPGPEEEERSPCENGIAVENPEENPGLVSDCESLLASRDALRGAATLDWDAGRQITQWQGITIEGTPLRVTRLGLQRRGLTGQIPAELGRLTALRVLRLSENQLTGPIPPELGGLDNLNHLYLNDNQLSGAIPDELAFLRESELTVVIQGNGGGLSGATTLTRVFLGGNAGLVGCIPPVLRGALKHDLDDLALPDCAPLPCENGTALASPADNAGLVRDCTALLLAGPLLAGDAKLNWDAETAMTAWEGVTIGGEPPRVQALELPSRGLTGHIPWYLNVLAGLRVLRLHGNQLTGAIPVQLTTLAGLQRLELHDNQLEGEIPETLSTLGALRSLHLSGNRLTGVIPEELAYLRAMQSLLLSDNELAGALPAQLGHLVALERLTLGGNRELTGCIPPGLWDVDEHDLASLGLPDCPPPPPPPCGNGVAVPNPAENPGLVADCIALLTAAPALAGSARISWDANTPITDWEGVSVGGTPPRVRGLHLSSRGLTGHIPAALGWLTALYGLDLADNQLSGSIPPTLGSLRVKVLRLNNNQLSGPVPEILRTLTLDRGLKGAEWVEVALYGNAGLTGCLPPWPQWPEEGEESSQAECSPPAWEQCENGTAVPDPADNRGLVDDCVALLLVRDPLAGEATLDWGPDRPITSWEGITIGGDPRRVVALSLPSRGLSGHLPPRLGRLLGLRDLRLSDNRLGGPIPSDLLGLRDLWWTDSRWGGPNPYIRGAMGLLRSVRLDGNQLIGPIPPTLGALFYLESLHLHDNRLSGPIPPILTYPPALQRLSVSGNAGLTGCLPPPLRTVPENDLAQLGLPDCPPPIPPTDLCANGTVVPNPTDNPGLVADCAALLGAKRAFVSDVPLNWLADRPITEWEGVTIGGTPGRIRALELRTRELSGYIPAQLGRLTELRDLALGHPWTVPANDLVGPIPAELGNLRFLRSLDLSGNLLTGPIPPELGSLSNLEALRLRWNRLTGPIPMELGNLARLEVLWLDGNELSGPIPAELGGLTALLRLDLAYNELSGPIPAELSGLTTLLQLDLAGNDLSGPIPAELGGLAALEHLDLSSNDLSGAIPATLGSLRNLESLWLGNNRLTGGIPPELGALAELEILYLGGNQLSGAIPAELGFLRRLWWIWLEGNQLTGSLPAELENLWQRSHRPVSGP